MFFTLLSIFVIGCLLVLAAVVIVPAFFGSPWHPLMPCTIRRVLEFAEIQPGEKFYDLGSGDGRVVIAAVKNFGAKGVGLEIDPLKISLARWLARRAGVVEHAKFLRQNIFACDVAEADVVYLYLTHQAMDRLVPDILQQLKPSARIICYRFCIRNMTPTKINRDNNLFLYRLDKGKRVDRYS